MNIKNTFCTIFIPNSTFDYLIDKMDYLNADILNPILF